MEFDTLAARIRGEYQEMPGLRLTLPQACRLWQLDRVMCETILAALVAEGFLIRTKDDAFLVLPGSSTRLTAHVPPRRVSRTA